MPDYEIRLIGDMLHVRSRGSLSPMQVEIRCEIPTLDNEVYALARDAAPGWDVRYIESEWRA